MSHLPVLSVGTTLSGPKCPFTTVETLNPLGGVAITGVAIMDEAASMAVIALPNLSAFMASLLFMADANSPQQRGVAEGILFLQRK
jgi:hypothetical protein